MHFLLVEDDVTTKQAHEPVLSYADIVIYPAEQRVMCGKQELELMPKEYKILEFFLRNQERIISRDMLLAKIWNIHFDPKTSVVETQISRLRTKLRQSFGHRLIKTVRGSGYKLEAG